MRHEASERAAEGVTRLSCEHVANRRLKTGASLKGWRRLKDVRKWSPGADFGCTWKNADHADSDQSLSLAGSRAAAADALWSQK